MMLKLVEYRDDLHVDADTVMWIHGVESVRLSREVAWPAVSEQESYRGLDLIGTDDLAEARGQALVWFADSCKPAYYALGNRAAGFLLADNGDTIDRLTLS